MHSTSEVLRNREEHKQTENGYDFSFFQLTPLMWNADLHLPLFQERTTLQGPDTDILAEP